MPFEKKEKVRKVCQNCGKIFLVKPYRKDKAKYCSAECKYESMSRKMKAKRANAFKQKLYPVKCQNINCGKVVYVKKDDALKRKFCCRACYDESRTEAYRRQVYRKKKLARDKRLNIWSVNSH